MMDINNKMMADAAVVMNNFLYMTGYSCCFIAECIVCWRQPEIRVHKSAKTDWIVSVWLGAVLG